MSPGTDVPPTTASTRRARRPVAVTRTYFSREESKHDADRHRGAGAAGPGRPQPGDRQGTHRTADRLRGRRRPGAPALPADVTAGVGSRARRQPGRTLAAPG